MIGQSKRSVDNRIKYFALYVVNCAAKALFSAAVAGQVILCKLGAEQRKIGGSVDGC